MGRQVLSCAASFLFCLIPFAATAKGDVGATGEEGRDQVGEIIRQVATGERNFLEGVSVLRELPKDEVVSAIVDLLRNDRACQELRTRGQAYRLLRDVYGATTEAGREQLVKGLGENEFSAVCAVGLRHVPAEHQGEVVPALVDALDDVEHVDGDWARATAVIDTLTKFGARAAPSLARLEEILENNRVDVRVRVSAARAILGIGGLERGLGALRELDPEDERLVIIPLGVFLMESEEFCAFYLAPELADARAWARDVVVRGMRSSDRETREVSLQMISPIYGPDLLDVRAPGEYDLHPAVRKALVEMAAEDTDSVLRDGAAQILDPERMKLIAERIQRTVRGCEEDGKREDSRTGPLAPQSPGETEP